MLSHDIPSNSSWMINCCFQNNFPVALKLLKKLRKEAQTNRRQLLRWVHSFSRYSHKLSQAQGPVEQVSTMLKTIPLLGKKGKEWQTHLCYSNFKGLWLFLLLYFMSAYFFLQRTFKLSVRVLQLKYSDTKRYSRVHLLTSWPQL